MFFSRMKKYNWIAQNFEKFLKLSWAYTRIQDVQFFHPSSNGESRQVCNLLKYFHKIREKKVKIHRSTDWTNANGLKFHKSSLTIKWFICWRTRRVVITPRWWTFWHFHEITLKRDQKSRNELYYMTPKSKSFKNLSYSRVLISETSRWHLIWTKMLNGHLYNKLFEQNPKHLQLSIARWQENLYESWLYSAKFQDPAKHNNLLCYAIKNGHVLLPTTSIWKTHQSFQYHH